MLLFIFKRIIQAVFVITALGAFSFSGNAQQSEYGGMQLPPWFALPETISTEQHQAAQSILDSSMPRIRSLQAALRNTMQELRSLAFATDTHDDTLSQLGTRLVETRDALLAELAHVRDRLDKELGITAFWKLDRDCTPLVE